MGTDWGRWKRVSRNKKEKEPVEIANGLVLRDDAPFDTEPRFHTLLMKGFVVYLVVMGSMGCLLSSFNIPYHALWIHLAVFTGSLFSAFLYYTKWWENLGYFVLFALMFGTALLFRRYISSGFFAVVNIISERTAYYFDTEVVQGYAESISNRNITVTVAMVYVGWVHAILLNALISRQMKYFAVMFASFFFLVVPFYLEVEPDMIYILMLMMGCIIVFAFRGAKHTPITKSDAKYEYLPKKRYFNYIYSAKHHIKMIAGLMIIVAVFGGCFQFFVNKDMFETKARGVSAWKKSTHDAVENVYKNGIWGFFNRYDSTGGLKSGILGGVNSVTLDYETDLQVTYVPYSADRMYLRSFTGDEYIPYENRWQRPTVLLAERIRDDAGQSYLRVSEQPLPEETTSSTAKLLKKDYEKYVKKAGSGIDAAKARMDVVNVAAALGTYLPYYVDEDASSRLQTMNYRQKYSLTYYPWIMNPGPVSEETEMEEQLKSLNTKNDDESNVHRVDKRVHYENVPEENTQVIDDFIRQAGLTGYRVDKEKGVNKDMAQRTISALGKYFQEHLPYTYQPGITPRRKDFVNYFLADNKRGYCAHFASAAALILRRLGYRTRYVEGYAIDATDFGEDAKVRSDLKVSDYYDGTLPLGDRAQVVTVNVTDAMAHAWVEVEVDGHWMIAELTPWSEETAPREGGFLAGLIDFLSGSSTGGSSGDGDASDVGAPAVSLDGLGRFFSYGVLILIAVAVAGILLIQSVLLIMRRVRYVRADYSERLVIDVSRLRKKWLKKNKKAPINYREFVEEMYAHEQDSDQTTDESKKQELIQILEKAGFSKASIDKETYERACEILSELK